MAGVLDFTQLSRDGADLEKLTRDLCDALGYRADWSGVGAHDGVDLVIQQPATKDFGGPPRLWMVSCKDRAVSGRAVSADDLALVNERLEQHRLHGFLLVTTTHLSTAAMNMLKGWAMSKPYAYHYWDDRRLTEMLLREDAISVRRAYFGGSAADAMIDKSHGAEFIKPPTGTALQGTLESIPTNHDDIYYLSDGNVGFYFQSRNREGHDTGSGWERSYAVAEEHLQQSLPSSLAFAVRGLWYDDKNSVITWYVDIAALDGGVHPDLRLMEDRLSQVLAHEDYGGVPHFFEFRMMPAPLNLKTPRKVDEAGMSLVSGFF